MLFWNLWKSVGNTVVNDPSMQHRYIGREQLFRNADLKVDPRSNLIYLSVASFHLVPPDLLPAFCILPPTTYVFCILPLSISLSSLRSFAWIDRAT
jgi:hypothetical protein